MFRMAHTPGGSEPLSNDTLCRLLRWGRGDVARNSAAVTPPPPQLHANGKHLKSQTVSLLTGSFAYPFAFAANVVLPTTSVSRASVVPPPAV